MTLPCGLGESQIWDIRMWSRVLWNMGQRKTSLARPRSSCILQTHSFVREGAPYQETRNNWPTSDSVQYNEFNLNRESRESLQAGKQPRTSLRRRILYCCKPLHSNVQLIERLSPASTNANTEAEGSKAHLPNNWWRQSRMRRLNVSSNEMRSVWNCNSAIQLLLCVIRHWLIQYSIFIVTNLDKRQKARDHQIQQGNVIPPGKSCTNYT
jgi:hypothetical protein